MDQSVDPDQQSNYTKENCYIEYPIGYEKQKPTEHYVHMWPNEATTPPSNIFGTIPKSTSFQIDLLDLTSQYTLSK